MININSIYSIRRKLAECCLAADYQGAIRLSGDLLNYYAGIRDSSSDNYGEDLFNIAFAYENIGDFKKAIRLYTESSRSIMESKGENADSFYRLMNIAVIYCKTGEYPVAIELFNSIIDGLRRKKINDVNFKFLCYYNIGSAYCSLGQYQEGVESFKKARKHCKADDGSNYFDILYLLGIAHMGIGEYRKASLFFTEASNVIRQAEPQNISELLNVLLSTSESFEKMGEYTRSIEKLSEALSLMESLLVKGNRTYTIIQMRMVSLYLKSDMHEKAIEICSEVSENTKKLVGESSLQYANSLRDMALVCKEAKQYETGVECLKKCVEIKSLLLGSSNKESIKDKVALIALYVETGELKQALDLLIQTIGIMDESGEEYDEFMSKLAELYMSLGEYGNFHSVHARALELNQPQDQDYEDYEEF